MLMRVSRYYYIFNLAYQISHLLLYNIYVVALSSYGSPNSMDDYSQYRPQVIRFGCLTPTAILPVQYRVTVTCAQPAVVNHVGCRSLVVEVSLHHLRAVNTDFAFFAGSQGSSAIQVHHLQRHNTHRYDGGLLTYSATIHTATMGVYSPTAPQYTLLRWVSTHLQRHNTHHYDGCLLTYSATIHTTTVGV